MILKHDSIEVQVPYSHKFFGLQFTINRKIGFAFTNLSNYLFASNNGLKNSNDYKAWVEKYGQTELIFESLHSSAQSWCMINRKPQNFEKEKLRMALSMCDKQTWEQIMEAWKQSETFGATVKKKHQTSRKSR